MKLNRYSEVFGIKDLYEMEGGEPGRRGRREERKGVLSAAVSSNGGGAGQEQRRGRAQGCLWPCLEFWIDLVEFYEQCADVFRMYKVLNKVYLRNLFKDRSICEISLKIGVTIRDEPNDGN